MVATLMPRSQVVVARVDTVDDAHVVRELEREWTGVRLAQKMQAGPWIPAGNSYRNPWSGTHWEMGGKTGNAAIKG